MKPIVESQGVQLHCPIEGRYAFFNSPFPAHKANTGVDIYPEDGFGGEAPSPVDGEVVLIRRVKAPEGHGFTASDHDTVVVLENKANPDTVTKMLHIDPLVEVGDTVRVGDSVGLTLRSGYYGWGTSPHIHAEIRNPLDPIRARGGYNLDLIEVPGGEPVDEIAGTVIHVQPEFVLIEQNSRGSGLVGTVNGEPATLDGGIPYYRWMGAHLLDPPSSGTIELLGNPIADITQSFKRSCKATCREFWFTVKNQLILGLSLNLWLSQVPIVKLIPLKKNVLDVETGEWVEVELKVS